MAATYEPIATTTLGTASNSITFTSIPSIYTDLVMVIVGQMDVQNTYSGVWVRFNNDTATNYSETYMYADGASTKSTGINTSSSDGIYLNNGFLSTSLNSMFTINLLGYSNSKYKTILAQCNRDYNGSGGIDTVCGLWRNTAAISTIKVYFYDSGSKFVVGSTATIYGIKAA